MNGVDYTTVHEVPATIDHSNGEVSVFVEDVDHHSYHYTFNLVILGDEKKQDKECYGVDDTQFNEMEKKKQQHKPKGTMNEQIKCEKCDAIYIKQVWSPSEKSQNEGTLQRIWFEGIRTHWIFFSFSLLTILSSLYVYFCDEHLFTISYPVIVSINIFSLGGFFIPSPICRRIKNPKASSYVFYTAVILLVIMFLLLWFVWPTLKLMIYVCKIFFFLNNFFLIATDTFLLFC
jgi:hypothetical protein